MKKILTILGAAALLFGISSCSTSAMHDADVMLVDKVVVDGLDNLIGQTMVISGNWILGADGTSNWVHGLGDTSNVAEGAIATVGPDGVATFEINQVTSEATLEFLGKVNEDGWVNANRFGVRAYTDADGNAKVANTFTGSDVPKIVYGKVGAGDVIAWSVVDAIPASEEATSVFISAVEMKNVTGVTIDAGVAADSQVFFLNGWLPGNQWGDTSPNKTALNGTRTFAAPVEVSSDTIEVQIRMMVTPSNFWDGEGNKPNHSASLSVANPKDGNTYVWSYDYSTNTVNLVAVP